MLAKKVKRRIRIHKGIRKRISGTSECPRIAVYRSNKEIYVQAIDDVNGVTLVSCSSRDKALAAAKGTKIEVSKQVGVEFGKKMKDAGFESGVFDRGGFLYHGRVKALAEGIREGGVTI